MNRYGQIGAGNSRGDRRTCDVEFYSGNSDFGSAAGDIVVMDNLTSHKTQRVRAAFVELGVELWYLPPYSPDLNPIEMYWSNLKVILN